MSEFWTRWHISLSSWLRDYLYIPLGGNRKGKQRTYINLMITMLLGGLWHGSSWNYVLWGLIHGIALVTFQSYRAVIKSPPSGWFVRVLNTAMVLLVVGLAWIPFRCGSFSDSIAFFRGILAFDFSGNHFLIPPIAVLLFAVMVDLPQIVGASDARVLAWKPLPRLSYLCAMIWLILLSGDLRGAAFIYFQF